MTSGLKDQSRLQILAPAKVNLRLEVLGELANGYHLLRMFNITVSLLDQIELEFLEQGIEIEVDDPKIPKGSANPVFRAIVYFQERFRKEFGIRVRIQKQIPAGAGLGGGSSDAGAVLRALMERFGLRLSELNLEEIAYKIGADVPYLLFGGPAWVSGIGEKIERVKEFPELFYLLVKPGFPSSTSEVFQDFQMTSDLTIEPKEVIFEKIRLGSWKEFCVNHLERVVFLKHPGLKELKSELIRLGASAVVMTGSGSTLVGIFSTYQQGERGKEGILNYEPGLWVQLLKGYQPGTAKK